MTNLRIDDRTFSVLRTSAAALGMDVAALLRSLAHAPLPTAAGNGNGTAAPDARPTPESTCGEGPPPREGFAHAAAEFLAKRPRTAAFRAAEIERDDLYRDRP